MATIRRLTSPRADKNLALLPGVRIKASVIDPCGGGARDPKVLLNDSAHRLHGKPLAEFSGTNTFDTFDGWNDSQGPDWYCITFPHPVECNCIEMTMGFPYRDGGWWTTLGVEFRRDHRAAWLPVNNLAITPSYDFEDHRGERRPFETYALTFDPVRVQSLRVIGMPGGIAQFTSLARLAVYERDLSRWNPMELPGPPLPDVFELIDSAIVWDISESMKKLCGLDVALPLMEYYLDEARFSQFWERIRHNYEGEPELWFLVGNVLGWRTWNRRTPAVARISRTNRTEPYIHRTFHNTLGQARAPVVVDGHPVGEVMTQYVILEDAFDLDWHKRWAAKHGIPWRDYQAAIERSPHKTTSQMEGAATLLGTIANTIASLAQHISRVSILEDDHTRWKRELVQRAIDLMEERLERQVTVSQVAHEVGLSMPYFCRIFTEQTGMPPSEYLINLRLSRAQEYLRYTDLTVSEVAHLLGYDTSYFSRLFKQRTGRTPGDYALQHRARH